MAFLAWIAGSLGGLCGLTGILTAIGITPQFADLTWAFWLSLSSVLLPASIAFAVGRSQYE